VSNELKFLVVEDDPVDAKTVCRILNHIGVSQKTDTVNSLEQAKRKVHQTHYDAVILDLGLPDSQGIDGVIEFQATAPEVPIVVLTGSHDERTALQSMDIGAEDFINKEAVTGENLYRSLCFAMERHRRKSEVFRDMDTLRLSLEDAQQQASTDPLTGLANRRGLQRYLEHLGSTNPRMPIIVGMADLDHFKGINDGHGHKAGDAVLREFAARLQHSLRGMDFAARIGGDEFVIVFGGLGRMEATGLGSRILNHIASTPAEDGGMIIPFTATLALAEIQPPFIDLEQILVQTHALLARGKSGGRNRVECSWEKEGRTAPEEPEGPSTAELSFFDEDRLLQSVRKVVAVSDELPQGYQLSFGLGLKSWPMVAPAVSRARLANRLSQMTLQCLRRAKEWRAKEAPGSELHLDIEADAIKPWVTTELTRIFPDEKERASCVLFFHTDFPSQPGALSLLDLRLLRQAGFKLGARNLGDGATILEHLQLLSPEWLRFDPALTINVWRYEKKLQSLKRMLEMLRPLGAKFAAEEIGGSEDLKQLKDLGFQACYSEERSRFFSD
jgi:diguanylate cyclase (GGDEF)-like protein